VAAEVGAKPLRAAAMVVASVERVLAARRRHVSITLASQV
jgi:hypothetical protein